MTQRDMPPTVLSKVAKRGVEGRGETTTIKVDRTSQNSKGAAIADINTYILEIMKRSSYIKAKEVLMQRFNIYIHVCVRYAV